MSQEPVPRCALSRLSCSPAKTHGPLGLLPAPLHDHKIGLIQMKTKILCSRWVLPLIGAVLIADLRAQTLTNLSGVWNGIAFDVPTKLTLATSQGLVTNLLESDSFAGETFLVSFQPDGTFTSPDTSGTISVNGQGSITVYPADSPPISFGVNATQDVLAGVANDSDNGNSQNGLNLLVKAPATLGSNDVAGAWNLMTFATPHRLVEVFAPATNGSALTDLLGLDNSSISGNNFSEIASGSLTINSNGAFSGSLEESFNGTYTCGTNGEVFLNINTGEGTLLLTNFINASKDIMFALNRQDAANRQEIVMLAKTPTNVTAADLQGVWKVTSFDTPAQIALTRNSSNFVTSVTASGGFSMDQQSFAVGHDGFVTAIFDGQPNIGALSIGTGGAITMNFTNSSGEAKSHTGYLNAAKNCLLLVQSNGGEREATVVAKAPDFPNASGQDFGLLFFNGTIYWASGTNRALQAASSLNGAWGSIPATEGQHQFQPVFTNSAGFYRVGAQ